MLRNELAEPEKTDAAEAVEESKVDPEAADKEAVANEEAAEAAPDSAPKADDQTVAAP